MSLKKIIYRDENKIILLLFVISTCWFVYQHYLYIDWDFAAYVLNAKYWFDNGFYFELLRPPLTPLIIGMFGLLVDWKIAEYLYVILVSIFFLFSSLKLADSLKFNRLHFYAISLNAYVLLMGLSIGTELLSFVFLELFIAYLIQEKYSGHFLALASLTRYNLLPLLPLLIYHKKPVKIIENLILFFLVWSPWLFYNYVNYGNIFASVFDNYLLNIAERQYIHQAFDPIHVLSVTNILTPFLLIGLFHFLSSLSKERLNLVDIFWKRKVEFCMLFILTTTFFAYVRTPIKYSRFLFNLILPTFYFAYIGIYQFKKFHKYYRLFFPTLFVLSLIIFLLALLYIDQRNLIVDRSLEIYKDAIKKIDSFHLNNCSLMSNGWVYLNYLGRPSKPSMREELVLPSLQEGEIILLFYHIDEPEYTRNSTFFQDLPIVYKNNKYILLRNLSVCKKTEIFDKPYLYQLNQTVYKIYNYTIDMNYCNLIVENRILAELCGAITYLDIRKLN